MRIFFPMLLIIATLTIVYCIQILIIWYKKRKDTRDLQFNEATQDSPVGRFVSGVILFIVTKPLGKGWSHNSSDTFEVSLKNQKVATNSVIDYDNRSIRENKS